MSATYQLDDFERISQFAVSQTEFSDLREGQ
jgi:hypothetical protein